MSDSEPVAWAIVGAEDNAVLDSHLYHTESIATRWANHHGDRVVPLYRQPQPTLTDEELEAIERLLSCFSVYISFRAGRQQ
jgi:hypothetical protein